MGLCCTPSSRSPSLSPSFLIWSPEKCNINVDKNGQANEDEDGAWCDQNMFTTAMLGLERMSQNLSGWSEL